MLLAILLLASFTTTLCEFVSHQPETFQERLARAKALLKEVPLIDGHNDLPWVWKNEALNKLADVPFDQNFTETGFWSHSEESATDLPRMKAGGVGGVFLVAYVDCDSQYKNAVVEALKQIDLIKRLAAKYPDDMELVYTSEGIRSAFQQGRIAILIGVEGGHMIDSSLAALRMLYDLGGRYLTLTHSCDTPWAESSVSEDEPNGKFTGLTFWGKIVISEMNRLGMLIDISHVSSQTMKDAIEASSAPVIFSHSSARALCDHKRNVPDDVLELVQRNGGIVMVNFYSLFIACHKENATLHHVIDHINHIKDVAGFDHVGIGSDYDGVDSVPIGLEDVSTFPRLLAELMLDPLWTDNNLKKLIGNNLLRVMDRVEQIKDSLRNTAPAEDLIPTEDYYSSEMTDCSFFWPDSRIPAIANNNSGNSVKITGIYSLLYLASMIIYRII